MAVLCSVTPGFRGYPSNIRNPFFGDQARAILAFLDVLRAHDEEVDLYLDWQNARAYWAARAGVEV